MSSLFVRFKNDIEKEVNRCLVPLMISFEEIESATDNFADKNYIGQDSTGKFYRGQLLQSGKMIDILVREFNEYKNRQNVIPTLLKHENIRGIINWTSINEGRDRVFFFAYKIEANGSLAEHLPSTGLTWAQRLSICIGVGQALKHIHYSDFVKPGYYVIHGNINSSDILLDDNWQPKLQGFKYAMVAERNTLLHVTSKYKCTLQYKDPSYEKTGALTDKSDVYSFGVVLFEVLFGRKADTPNGDDEDHWNFAEFARSHWKNKTLDDVMIDRDMRKSIDSQSFEIFSNVAYACLTEQREERPNMEQVVRELEKSLQLQKNHEHSMATETSSRNLQGESFEHLRIPLKDIQSATEGFDSKYKIGSGGFATVYRAKLKHFQSKNSTTIESGDDDVAIKVISSTANGFGEKGFIAEVKMLSKCKHPNIVSLLGFCDEGPQKILIYEYVPNGSLDGYLERSYRMTNLTWGRRLQICLDIARGLDYLHSGLNGNEIIIHRDIKSANILLDDNLRAKISDFGLSRLSIIGSKNSTINTYNIAGTDFYLDPAYQKTGDLKKASDIYSFGVVLFEILCGTLAYDKIHTTDTENGLPSIARRLFKEGKLKAIVDPSIKETDGSIFSRSRVADQNSLDIFLSIANQCLVETQKERPTIKEVIKELEKALSFQGLIEAVKDVLPYAEHRQCARHIYEGFRKRFTGVHFRAMFWAASKASYPTLFEKCMTDIRNCDPRAHQYLMDKNPKTWSRAFFKLNRACENVENGFSECFNSVILTVRNKPIITLFEAIRAIIMERQGVMRELCTRWKTDIAPCIVNKLDWVKEQQRFWKPSHAGGTHWEVRQLNESFKVDELERTCSCRMWSLSGLPCPHACAVIFKMGRDVEDYVPGWFRKANYLKTYSSHIMPVGGMSTWRVNNTNKPLPPMPRRMPGRPKKKRRRASHEGGSQKARPPQLQRISREGLVMTCSNCHEKGHNKSKCPKGPVPSQANVGITDGVSKKGKHVVGCSRGHATVSINGEPVAQASLQVSSNSRGQASVQVVGKTGYNATVELNGNQLLRQKTPIPVEQMQGTPSRVVADSPDGCDQSPITPIPTQESQASPCPPLVTRRRWTRCKILSDKSPTKSSNGGAGSSKGLIAENVIIGSQSVINKSKAALAITSAGYKKSAGPRRIPSWWGMGICVDPVTNETYIGGRDSIPVPVWPKDVPIPSANEEFAKKQKAMQAVNKKVAEGSGCNDEDIGAKKAASEGSNKKAKMMQGHVSTTASECLQRQGNVANKQVRREAQPITLRARSERIIKKKLGQQVKGPGSTPDDALEL